MPIELGKRTLGSPGSVELMQLLEINCNPFVDPMGFLTEISGLDPSKNPDGSKKERYLFEGKTDWGHPYNAAILKVAEEMGMTSGEIPLQNDADIVIIAGGARREPDRRSRFAASFSQEFRIGRMVCTGSKRILAVGEPEAVNYYAPLAQIEYDLAVEGAAIAGAAYPSLQVTPFMSTMTPAHNEVVIEAVLDAFSIDKLPQIKSFAYVTTKIYGLAAYMDLLRVAKRRGIEGYIVCNPSDEKIIANRSEITYLIEIFRTWLAAVKAMQEGI